MEATVATSPIQLDADGRLTQEIPCLTCGYLLVGRRMDEGCPECGKAVEQSVHSGLLQFRPAAWVGKLRLGIHLLMAMVAVTVVGWALMTLLPVLMVTAASQSGAVPNMVYLGAFTIGATVLGVAAPCLLLSLGVWQVAQPPHDVMMPKVAPRWRRLGRVAAVLIAWALVAEVVGVAAGAVDWSDEAGWVIGIASVSLAIACPVALVSMLFYLAKLAPLLPNLRLGRHCRIVGWGIAVGLVLLASMYAAQILWIYTSVQGQMAATTPAPTTAATPAISPTAKVTNTQTTTNIDGSVSTHTTYDDGTFVTDRLATDGSRVVMTQWPSGSVTTTTTTAAGATATQTTNMPQLPAGMAWIALMGVLGCGGVIATLTFSVWFVVLLFWWRNELTRCRAVAMRLAA